MSNWSLTLQCYITYHVSRCTLLILIMLKVIFWGMQQWIHNYSSRFYSQWTVTFWCLCVCVCVCECVSVCVCVCIRDSRVWERMSFKVTKFFNSSTVQRPGIGSACLIHKVKHWYMKGLKIQNERKLDHWGDSNP